MIRLPVFTHSRRRAGFTMIEMMVVLAIIGILTAGVVGNYGSFRSATVATNMAYELAGSVRQAQLYGLGVRLNGQAGTSDDDGNPNDTYGVELVAENPTYSIFRDKGILDATCDDGACNCSNGSGECVEQVTMLQQVTVEALCTGSASAETPDLLSSTNCIHPALSIVYTRPNPEPAFHIGETRELADPSDTVSGVLVRGGVHCRLVRVYSNGQVSVESVPASSAGSFASVCGGA